MEILLCRENYRDREVQLRTRKSLELSVVSRCLKITEKVSFNIASEASYVYILSGQKLIKNAKNQPFWRVFENPKLAVKQCYQTGQFKRTKMDEKCQNVKIQMRHFG